MTSILTNNTAMNALQNLAQTQQSLAQTQKQISSGLKVGSAQDDAAYWSISQTMRTNVSNLSAVTDSLNLGSSVLATATSATNNIYTALQSISKNLVSAAQPGTDLTALQTSINTLRQQLASTVATASFNGVNMLDGSNGNSVSFVGGLTGKGASTTINSISISTLQTNMNGANYVVGSNALAKTAETADAALVAGQAANTAAVAALTTAAAGLASSDYTSMDSAFKSVYGSSATYSSGTISGISGTGAAAALLGTGTGTQVTVNTTTFAVTGYTSGGATAGGTLTALYGASSTNATTAGTATGGFVVAANTADANALANPAAKTAYLVDTAAAAVNANAAAKAAYTTAQTAFTTAVASLTTTDYTSASSAFKAIFGNNATYTSGVVAGMAQGSTAAALMGTQGSYTVSTGAYSQTGSDGTTGGALYSLYGANGTNTTTDATATGGTALAAKNAVAAVNNDANGSSIFNGGLFAISQINLVGASAAQIQGYTAQIGQALQNVTTAQEVLGAASSNITLQTNYTSALSDALTSGVGSLVDADMNVASTRLQALQTQQQLGIQSLSIANQNSQLILKLFQG